MRRAEWAEWGECGSGAPGRTRGGARRWGRQLALAAGVGIVAGLAAALLEAGLSLGTDRLLDRVVDVDVFALGGPSWAVLLLPVAGGLFSGIVHRLLAPSAVGHGTDQLVAAFHRGNGRLDLTGPAVKASASIGVIACGGSAGPEGPTAALGAAIGSTAGRLFQLTPRDCRTLLVAGCAAGVGAVFGCPLGGALFASSVMYREPEFEGTALVSAFIASALGYSSYVAFWGTDNRVLADTGGLAFGSGAQLPVYVLLGVLCGLVAIFYSLSFSHTERFFHALRPVPIWLRPALGGLLTGLVACAVPQVMDGRYRTVQSAFDGVFVGAGDPTSAWIAVAALLALVVVAKCVATAFTVGSGAAGGVLGPSVFIGGAIGAALGAGLEGLFPGTFDDSLRRALIPVGMAGVLSASMRTPLAAMVIVMEMTGSFGLIVPLMLVSMTAYVIGRRWGLISDQVKSAADSPAHAGDALVNLLERYEVGEVMDRAWPARAHLGTPLPELLEAAREAPSPTIAVIDDDCLVGVISLAELRHLLDDVELPPVVIAADLMTERPFALRAEDDLYAAVAAFEQRGLDVIPVVDDEGPRRGTWLGMLTRADVQRVARVHMETLRGHFLREHRPLAALEEEGELTHLLSALAPQSAGELLRVPVDDELVGRSLAQLDFRATRHQEVLAMQTRDRAFLCPPDPHRALERGDSLLVLTRRIGQDTRS